MMTLRSTPVTGLLVHVNRDPVEAAWRNLYTHCENRKYFHKAEGWFGICLDPQSKKLRFGIALEFPWKNDPTMDQRTNSLYGGEMPKVGPNSPCPCGSGKKHKNCHGHRP